MKLNSGLVIMQPGFNENKAGRFIWPAIYLQLLSGPGTDFWKILQDNFNTL
jgi:hypothetical protein